MPEPKKPLYGHDEVVLPRLDHGGKELLDLRICDIPGKGHWRGLSTVYGIVRQNVGRIEVRGAPGTIP